MIVTLSVLEGIPVVDELLAKPFPADPRFKSEWWNGSAKGPLIFCSFTDERGEEVARAQLNPNSSTGSAYPAWRRPNGGVTEIDILEVRPDLQGLGFGTRTVALILDALPPPVIALALKARAEDFWRTTRLTEFNHPELGKYDADGPRPLSLFVWLE